MTDAPTNEMDLSGLCTSQKQPFTVILMMEDDMRADESCAADWVRRVWVWGEPSDQGVDDMIEQARSDLAEMFGWNDQEIGHPADEIEALKAALEPVAIYAGHIFDIYQP